ncbi:MAG: hypothetical protein B6D64_04540 [Bacteroidetes bacterium 4484_276]|nr:MAG: hypothetical protein B6D64_04540 [Bacteroidetes bacterium 4484_276]
MTISTKIENTIKQSDKGELIFISDFSELDNYDTVRKSLQRLVKKELIIRISKGIYYYPKKDEILGILYPSIEEIGKAIAKRDKARIIPTGAFAQHLLGLSTQIPMNIIYLTDGSARKIKIGKQTIVFKKTSPKNLSYENQLSSLIIQSLKSKKENNITEKEKEILKEIIIKSGKQKEIEKDIKNSQVWIRRIILQILSEIKNELA